MHTDEHTHQHQAIEVKGLHKSFGRTPVLRDLDLDVPWGQTLTVLGPNGSGKSTLIKALASLSKPDAGLIRVAGADIYRAGRSIRRVVGVVAHDTGLYDGLTPYENLRFHARMFGLDRADERITAVAEKMGVTPNLLRRTGTLSHGTKKRVTIARALLHDPRILLLDEPESGLDQEALALLEDVILDRSNPFRTVVVTTHNLERGLALGERMAILARGRVVYEDTPASAGADALREAYFRVTGTES